MAKNLNMNETAEAWAQIVLTVWEEQIEHYDLIDTKQLIESLAHHVHLNSNGNPDRIDFFYKWYGKMVDMGVGGNVDLENQTAMIASKSTERRPKPWFSSTFYYQVHRIGELLAQKFAQKSAAIIVNNIGNNANQWETH